MKDWKTLINDASIALALITAIMAEVVVVIVEGTTNIAATSLPAAVIALAGGLLGSKLPKP